MVFILKNNLDKREFTFEVTDKVSSSLFYTFDINLPEGISDGEYTYYLKVNDKVVSKGICIVGDYNLDITKYEEEKGVEYYVYDGDSDNVVAYVDTKAKPEQSKSLSVEKNGSYEITPDSGLVLNKVDISVDVQPTPIQSKSETYVSNGSYSVTPDNGYNLSKVDIDVNVPSVPLQEKKGTYTENGSYSVTPDEGYNLSKVDVTVDVDVDVYYNKGVNEQKAKLVSTAITENGTYSKADGYNKVTVNVADTPTQTKTLSATSNGTYNVTPDDGYNLSRVDVEVKVPTGENVFKAYVDGSLTTIRAEDLDGITKIADRSFYYYSALTSVTIPSSVTSIGERAFESCENLTSVTLPNSVTSIGDSAFDSCKKLTSITIPSGVTSISDYAFFSCSALTSVTIPSSVTSIGYNCFCHTSLISIELPSSVTSISDYAFFSCEKLTSLTILATTPPTISNNGIVNTTDCRIYVPSESLSAYKSAKNWSDMSWRIQAITE